MAKIRISEFSAKNNFCPAVQSPNSGRTEILSSNIGYSPKMQTQQIYMDQLGWLYESLDCLLYYQHPLFFLSLAKQNCAKLSRTLIFNFLFSSTNNNFKCFWSKEFKQAKED